MNVEGSLFNDFNDLNEVFSTVSTRPKAVSTILTSEAI